ncbi:MAG: antitoxin [bacterium]|nr:antitoxin [bacterium]
MTLTKSYITDETGKVTSVILDYATYQHFEELLLEQGLLSAMEEVDDEETVAYADVKDLIEAL